MPLPIVYRTGGDVQVNYDFADVVSGTGYISFYPAASALTGGNVYFLSRDTEYGSDPVNTDGYTASATYVKVLDFDFDYLLDKPLTLSGDGTINVINSLVSPSPSGQPAGSRNYSYVVAKIRRWDGVTETDLVTVQGSEFDEDGQTSIRYRNTGLAFTMPENRIKKGETIRLTIEVWAKGTTTQTNVDVPHDPSNRTEWAPSGSGNFPSQMIFKCPLRLDI